MLDEDAIRQLLPSKDEFLKLITDQQQWVKSYLAGGRQDSVTPTLVVLLKRDHTDTKPAVAAFVLAVGFNDYAEKRGALMKVGRSLYDSRVIPVAAALTTEAWVASMSENEMKRPSECPDRKEVIVISAATPGRDRLAAMSVMEVTRSPNGNIIPTEFGGVETEGVKVNILDHLWEGFFEYVAKKYGFYDRNGG